MTMPAEYIIIQAPTDLGLRPTGVDQLAGRLLELDLHTMIGARVGAVVGKGTFEYNKSRDPQTGYLNLAGVRDHAVRLGRAVGKVLDDKRSPIVLGGDCSVLLGAAVALKV